MSSNARTVMAVRSLPAAATRADPAPAEAIEILIPGRHAVVTVAYITDDGLERKSLVRSPMVSVIPPSEACCVRNERPAETLVLAIAPEFFAQQACAALEPGSRPKSLTRSELPASAGPGRAAARAMMDVSKIRMSNPRRLVSRKVYAGNGR